MGPRTEPPEALLPELVRECCDELEVELTDVEDTAASWRAYGSWKGTLLMFRPEPEPVFGEVESRVRERLRLPRSGCRRVKALVSVRR